MSAIWPASPVLSTLNAADAYIVTFKHKDYRVDGPERFKVMTLATGEFIRRFLSHVLPKGFHRIRHYGMLGNGRRADNVARARELLGVLAPTPAAKPKGHDDETSQAQARACPCCGSPMHIIDVFARGSEPKYRPSLIVVRIDTS